MTCVLLAALFSALAPAAESADRIAVLVGSNHAAAGRSGLRYADQDVQRVAEVLIQAGRFPAAHVHALLDPEPDQVLRALDDALTLLKKQPGETMLFFYFSGHADDQSLFVNGNRLPFDELRSRLDRTDSTVRVGVVDACRGGAWTRAKGLVPQAPFEVELPLKLASEGSVLIASSSGLENAHEAESLRGSFFTHHLVAGLRGAADTSGDGIVTLNEVYAYAKELTVRDTALSVDAPQHPSFSMNLRGRSDLPLTVMANSSTVLAVEERRGPLQLIHRSTGLKVLELSEGERKVLLAIAPGKYILRRKQDDRIFAREFTVAVNQNLTLDEGSLTLVVSDQLAVKGIIELHPSARTTLPARTAEIGFGLGRFHVSQGPIWLASSEGGLTANLYAAWGLTDRLQLSILPPGISYRLGERAEREWIFGAGLFGFGVSNVEGFIYSAALGVSCRQWFGERSALNAGISLGTVASVGGSSSHPPNDWSSSFTLGYSHYLSDLVTLNVAVSWTQQAFRQGRFNLFSPADESKVGVLGIGSVQGMGWRPLPLVQLHLGRVFSLFGDVSLGWEVPSGSRSEQYVLGGSWVF